MSENVKIDIQERDLTSGAGIANTSSDVAFVLGLARGSVHEAVVLDKTKPNDITIRLKVYEFDSDPGYPYKEVAEGSKQYNKQVTANRPVLCRTLEEFEDTFGYPYTYSAADKDTLEQQSITVAVGEIDRSYIYATELLRAGMPVVYCPIALVDLYAEETADTERDLIFEALADRNEYSVKYITSGGYPSVTQIVKTEDGKTTKTTSSVLAADLMKAAKTRGDAVALIDYINDEEHTHTEIYDAFSSVGGTEDSAYGAAMYPWGEYTTVEGIVKMPASFGYLLTVAKAIKTSPNWLAMAGVARGVVPNLKSLCNPSHPLTNMIAEDFQPKNGTDKTDLKSARKISINCITNIRPYGLTIWGNRTLKEVAATGCTATNFLHIRNMVSDIKKVLYSTAKSLMFEQNTETLWLRFKSGVTPLLDQLVSGGGLSDYKIIRSDVNNEGSKLQRGQVAAVVKIFPVDAVEYFELMVEISDNDVTLS